MGYFWDGPISLSVKHIFEIHNGLKVMMKGTLIGVVPNVEPEPHYFMIFSKVENPNSETWVISEMVPLA